MRVLFIGDIFGRVGRLAVAKHLPKLRTDREIDFCIANGENSKGGKGITAEVTDMLYTAGVDVITLGNHAWDNKKVFDIIDSDPHLVRAYNYPPGVPGAGMVTVETGHGVSITVVQLLCRLFMNAVDCPFQSADRIFDQLGDSSLAIVDLHGEATSEKYALGWYLDGRAAAVIGTHTHIPTADERILPHGTAYITDAGMTGPYDSVIGIEIDTAIGNFRYPYRQPFKPATGNVKIAGVIMEFDVEERRATSIERLFLDVQEMNEQAG